MKKTSANNRRKKLPLLLGALLIISVAAYGTRAYFSDSATEQANIQLSLGTLDIKSEVSTWKYTSTGNNINSALLAGTTSVATNPNLTAENAKNITNVQPGDQFERIFEFKNVGSLEQVVTVDNKVLSAADSIFKVDFKQLDKDGNELTDVGSAKIISGGSVKYKMIISVKTEDSFDATHNQKNSNIITNDLVFNALQDSTATTDIIENAVTVKANQVNK
jgi:hypothetical protein